MAIVVLPVGVNRPVYLDDQAKRGAIKVGDVAGHQRLAISPPLKKFHSQDGQRSGELAQLLRDIAALAEELKDRIVEDDSDFDPKLIAEARSLANQLATAAPSAPERAAAAQRSREATRVRNRLLQLLTQQVSHVRKGAARAFAHHPELVREATSAHERRRRAEARRTKKSEPTPVS